MYTDMEMWTEVRRRVLTKELSKRAACEGILNSLGHAHQDPGACRTARLPESSSPDRSRRSARFLPIIHKILEDDRQAPRKQRHTAKRIFDRLVTEHQFDGGYTIVKDAVRAWKQTEQGSVLAAVAPDGRSPGRFRICPGRSRRSARAGGVCS